MLSASKPYSTHVCGSSRSSSRSRTVSLPSECCRSMSFSPPMSSAFSRRFFRSSTSGPQSWTSPPPDALAGSVLRGFSVTAQSSHGTSSGCALRHPSTRGRREVPTIQQCQLDRVEQCFIARRHNVASTPHPSGDGASENRRYYRKAQCDRDPQLGRNDSSSNRDDRDREIRDRDSSCQRDLPTPKTTPEPEESY